MLFSPNSPKKIISKENEKRFSKTKSVLKKLKKNSLEKMETLSRRISLVHQKLHHWDNAIGKALTEDPQKLRPQRTTEQRISQHINPHFFHHHNQNQSTSRGNNNNVSHLNLLRLRCSLLHPRISATRQQQQRDLVKSLEKLCASQKSNQRTLSPKCSKPSRASAFPAR